MIENDKQYRLTVETINRMQLNLDRLRIQEKCWIRDTMIEGVKSQIETLQDELMEYEDKK